MGDQNSIEMIDVKDSVLAMQTMAKLILRLPAGHDVKELARKIIRRGEKAIGHIGQVVYEPRGNQGKD